MASRQKWLSALGLACVVVVCFCGAAMLTRAIIDVPSVLVLGCIPGSSNFVGCQPLVQDSESSVEASQWPGSLTATEKVNDLMNVVKTLKHRLRKLKAQTTAQATKVTGFARSSMLQEQDMERELVRVSREELDEKNFLDTPGPKGPMGLPGLAGMNGADGGIGSVKYLHLINSANITNNRKQLQLFERPATHRSNGRYGTHWTRWGGGPPGQRGS
jgi:hypothetical protein